MTWLLVTWSNLVFWLKTRAGFRQLETVVGVTGVVTSVEIAEDGDACFSLVPDHPGSLLTYRTSGAVHACDSLHCEIVPADRARLAMPIAQLVPGVRVKVAGRRAWDGCHHGRSILFDGLMVLLRAAPVLDGWIEIHPVSDLEVLL